MSNDAGGRPKWVIDCAGLHKIANIVSGNLKNIFLQELQAGRIVVPSRVWAEFRELFPEEAEVMAASVTVRIRATRKYMVGAASVAERLNSGFIGGPYESYGDFYAASVSIVDDICVITTSQRISFYEKMKCAAIDCDKWAEKFE